MSALNEFLDLMKAWAPRYGTGGVEVRWRGKFKAPPRPGLMWSEISHRWVSQKEADPTGATGYLKRLVRVTSGTTPEELKTAAESIATEFAHNDKPEYAKTFKEGTATIFQEEGKSLTQLKDGLKRLMEKHKHQIEDSLGTGKDKEAREDEGSAETHETKLQAEAAEAEKKEKALQGKEPSQILEDAFANRIEDQDKEHK